MKTKTFEIECPSCGKTFPIVAKLDEKKGKSNSLEVNCPFCGDLLTVELPDKLGADTSQLRGKKT